MKKGTRKFIIFVIIFLIVSSMYIGVHIDFKQPIYYENYTKTSIFHNAVRVIMGISPVVKGYEGISPKFFTEIIIKIIIAIGLLIYLIMDYYKNKNKIVNIKQDDEVVKIEKNMKILGIITKIIISIPLIFIFLLNLYMTYWNIHSIR